MVGGANSDRPSLALHGTRNPSVIPKRGEYWHVTNPADVDAPDKNKNSVPQKAEGSHFLVVHFTPGMEGEPIVSLKGVSKLCRTGYS